MNYSTRFKITKREKEILWHLSQGLTNREVAKTLFISCNTVDTHRKRIMAKLDVRSGMQMGVKAVSMGLLSA